MGAANMRNLMGKDAYCEKPIPPHFVEARIMAKAVAYHKKIVQVGTC
jgi:predicted dehydrogenase